MKKTRLSKSLAILLALIMVLALLPVTALAASSDATLTSGIATVDNTGETITDIPHGTTLAEFTGSVTPAAGAGFEVYEADGLTIAGDLQSGYKVLVTAEDGTMRTYTVTMNAPSVNATLSGGTLAGVTVTGSFAGGETIESSSELAVTIPHADSSAAAFVPVTDNAVVTAYADNGTGGGAYAEIAENYDFSGTNTTFWIKSVSEDGNNTLYYKLSVNVKEAASVPFTLTGVAISGDGSEGSAIEIIYSEGAFSGTLPVYTDTAAKNTIGIKLTADGLPEGSNAKITLGNTDYMFVENVATTGSDIVFADVDEYAFQVVVMPAEGASATYPLTLTKADNGLAFKGSAPATFFKGEPAFSAETIIAGQPEGSVLQLDAAGNLTGKTGIDPTCYEYQLYVGSASSSITVSKPMDMFKLLLSNQRVQIYVDGIAKLGNPADIPTSLANASIAGQVALEIHDGTTEIIFALLDKGMPDVTKHYTFHVQRLSQMGEATQVNTVALSDGVFSSDSGFRPNQKIQGIECVDGTENVTLTMTADADITLYKTEVSEENRLTKNENDAFDVLAPTSGDFKIIAERHETVDGISVRHEAEYVFKFFLKENLNAGTKNPGTVTSVDVVERIINYCPAPASAWVATETVESGYFDWIYEGLTSWRRFASLGGFGGYMTFAFDENPIVNDPNNPYGIDFIVYGNNFAYGAAEPAGVQVSADGETWYTLAGSMHYEETTLWSEKVTLVSGKEVTSILLARDTLPMSPLFGYAEVHCCSENKNAEDNYLVTGESGNPYHADHVKNIGDGFDLDWAVDQSGKPVHLDQIKYIRTQNVVDIDHPSFGTNSPEIGTITRSKAANNAVGVTAAPSSLKINGVEYIGAEPTETTDGGKVKYFEIDLADQNQAVASVHVTGSDDDNISINNELFVGTSDYVGLLKTDGSRMVRVIVQSGEKEPVIYVFNLTGGGNPAINADLSAITLTPGDVSLSQNGGGYTATVENNVQFITLMVKALNPEATIKLDGTVITHDEATEALPVSVGENSFTLTITSTDGSCTKTFPIVITRKSADTSSDMITVNFTFTGTTIHYIMNPDDKYLPGTPTGPYVVLTWLPKTAVTVPKGSTVKYVTDMVLMNAGIDFHTVGGTYIDYVQIPGTNPPEYLSEFDNGPNSGWMYRLNGLIANEGYAARLLNDGDTVLWFYTDDYTKETNYEGPLNPSDSSSASASETATVTATTTVVNGAASASVNKADIDAILDSAEENGTTGIVIDAKTDETATKSTVELPAGSASDMAKAGMSLKVETSTGTFDVDNAALKEVAAAGDGKVELSAERLDADGLSDANKELVGDHPVFDLSITVGGTKVTDFGDGAVTVSLPYTPTEGEDTSNLTIYYIDDAGNAVEMTGAYYDEATGMIIFKTDHFSKFAVVNEGWTNPFTDVTTDDWFYDEVLYVAENGLMNGTSDTLFSPDADMTRAMFVTVLYRQEGKPTVTADNPFTDVEDGEWYTNAVIWANNNDIVDGYGNGLFGTNDTVTREQMAKVLYGYADYKGYDVTAAADLAAFTDAEDISDWAEPAMRWACAEELVNGVTETTLDPSGSAVRAQVATIFMRFVESIAV